MLENCGKYKIICELARGGMGIVYKAEDPDLQRLVAIKELFLEQVEDSKRDEFIERFRREAILAANLRHPNIVSIYDVSISKESAYYIMELLTGVTLRGDLEKRPGKKMSAEEFLPILSQTCKGLSHAREMNLVHRDIKPDNIFILPDGTVKITDFGIARSQGEENSNLTKPGELLGTLAYVSPEQLQDARNVDHRADAYSLAVVAYEALVGRVPFAEDGLSSTLMAIITKEATPANEANPEVSPDIAAVIAKAMRKRPDERYASVTEFEKEFERAMTMQRGASSGMLRGGSTTAAAPRIGAPGIPRMGTPASGSVAPAAGLNLRTSGQNPPASAEDGGKAVVKPWLSGRSAERARPVVGVGGKQAPPPITTSVPLVRLVGKIGVAGDYQGAFLEPGAICARGGKIVVADTAARKFQIFNRDGKSQGESRCSPAARMGSKTNGGVFTKPSALAIDSVGRIYAADNADHYVRIFDAQGNFLREFANKQQAMDVGITGLVCDEFGNIFVSDPDSGTVHIVTSDIGTWIRRCGSRDPSDPGYMQQPYGIAFDSFGQLYVVDYGTSRILVFSNEGKFQRAWGGRGKGKSEFTGARGIAIDKMDRVYVVDSLNNRIQVFSAAGDYLFSFGGMGAEPGRFMTPMDISVDDETGLLYVVDKGNCRIQVYETIL